MDNFSLHYFHYNENSILIEWPAKIDETILKDIQLFKNRINCVYGKQLLEVISAYNSILIIYEFTIDNANDEFIKLQQLYLGKFRNKDSENKLWKIPVCYHPDYAIDLEHFACVKRRHLKDIVQMHTTQIYTVYFIGFLPGFLYLGGLDEKLFHERKLTPDLNVKKGSVAIGGKQTGIYPQNSPGGWHIIGNTPIEFFNPKNQNPCFAKSGDKIQFVEISPTQHNEISEQVNIGNYKIESSLL